MPPVQRVEILGGILASVFQQNLRSARVDARKLCHVIPKTYAGMQKLGTVSRAPENLALQKNKKNLTCLIRESAMVYSCCGVSMVRVRTLHPTAF